MPYTKIERKGVKQCFIETGIDPEKLRLHISEAAPGTSLHAPHTHDAIEAFYLLEGQAEVEFEGGRVPLAANEAFILDATKSHCLHNVGKTTMRYIVMMAKR